MKLISQETMKKILNFAYEKAINGIPEISFDSAYKLAEDYKKGYPNDLEKQIDSFINWQCKIAALSGISTGLGGFITMAVTLPANITTVLAIQLRMITTIALLCGYDVKNDKVKILVYCCLVKQSFEDIIKSIGVKFAEKYSIKLIQRIPYDVIKVINKYVGMKLITKFGQKGLINLGKLVPFVGCFLGATIDWTSTKAIGVYSKNQLMSEVTKQNFIETEIIEEK
jgi:hypothetical protein